MAKLVCEGVFILGSILHSLDMGLHRAAFPVEGIRCSVFVCSEERDVVELFGLPVFSVESSFSL